MKKLAFISVVLALAFSAPARADLSAAYSYTQPTGSVATTTYAYETPKVTKKVTKTRKVEKVAHTGTRVSITPRFNAGPKPGRWCGWYARRLFGGGPEYNLARNWAKRGTSAGGPRVGAVVVWPNHVGVIVGRSKDGRWLVHSGNTAGGRIATKPRSVSGAIAFRNV